MVEAGGGKEVGQEAERVQIGFLENEKHSWNGQTKESMCYYLIVKMDWNWNSQVKMCKERPF